MLSQYGPDLLVQCELALEMSRELVRTWLKEYMFKSEEERTKKAESVSTWLAEHLNFKSHSRHIPRNEIEDHELKVIRMEDDLDFQDLALFIFHATTHAFAGTYTSKIVENHLGRAFIKHDVLAPMQVVQTGVNLGNYIFKLTSPNF